MVFKRACVNAVRAAEGFSPRSQSASLSIRNFSSQTGRWAGSATQSFKCGKRRVAISSLQESQLKKASAQFWCQSSRQFSSTPAARHGHLDAPKPGEERHVTFIDKDGDSYTFTVADGDNLLDIAQSNDLEMEGACGGSCACSTCHVIVEDEKLYDKMEEPDDEENDMLDLAFGLTETSRLGCQVKMSKELDGLVVRLPAMTRNLQASDFK